MTAQAAITSTIDPATLTQQQRRAISLFKAYRLYRRPNGFGRPPASVSLAVFKSLQSLGLVRIYGDCPVLTGAGLIVHGVMEQRAERKRK
ncbi:hypothetical protein [Mesorhizobium sp. M8A.F.Ca.ET.021.01.1.1]|uniref:hypothetical protein n=1 Tax=Mesorhizobium sp. M8A.F.Ca.ET.021.01.1.1 TaxID=2496757 RepID=UPI000FCA9244|nr:hypothetical protein [Mesorhizobium sp. M8A.F.Ca.ET.021.01.1.1]RUW50975.1 hypothetical protein EOA36_15440 [Mesorhizobium sp. M8A.F.Ca.ET.021.01.1.1]